MPWLPRHGRTKHNPRNSSAIEYEVEAAAACQSRVELYDPSGRGGSGGLCVDHVTDSSFWTSLVARYSAVSDSTVEKRSDSYPNAILVACNQSVF